MAVTGQRRYARLSEKRWVVGYDALWKWSWMHEQHFYKYGRKWPEELKLCSVIFRNTWFPLVSHGILNSIHYLFALFILGDKTHGRHVRVLILAFILHYWPIDSIISWQANQLQRPQPLNFHLGLEKEIPAFPDNGSHSPTRLHVLWIIFSLLVYGYLVKKAPNMPQTTSFFQNAMQAIEWIKVLTIMILFIVDLGLTHQLG